MHIIDKQYHNYFGIDNIETEVDGILYIEEWKPINGYETIYEISSFGRIKCLERIDNAGTFRKERIRPSVKATRGYRTIELCLNGVKSSFGIHVLVAIHFIKNPLNKRTVNHEDGIKYNNHISNLSWATDTEQINHAYKTGLQKREARAGINNPSSKKVIDEATGIVYECVRDAAKANGLLEPTLSRYLTGKRKNKTRMSYV
jgi:hypothetical protein